MADFALYRDTTRIAQPVDQRALTARFTREATEFIARAWERPFLLVLAHTAPHIPLHPSPRFRGRSAIGRYGDVVEGLDCSTGEIVAALHRAGVDRDTLVLFTSDNGPFFEGSSGGLRGGKGSTWEGGYRVPLIASWPAVIATHGVASSMTMNIDLLPTIAEAIGVRPATMLLDGRSLMPVLAGTDRTAHGYLYFFDDETIVGLRSADWKLVTHAYYRVNIGSLENFARLPGFDGPHDLLFDLAGMVGEQYDVGDRHPQVRQRLRSTLRQARSEFDRLRTHAPAPVHPQRHTARPTAPACPHGDRRARPRLGPGPPRSRCRGGTPRPQPHKKAPGRSTATGGVVPSSTARQNLKDRLAPKVRGCGRRRIPLRPKFSWVPV